MKVWQMGLVCNSVFYRTVDIEDQTHLYKSPAKTEQEYGAF